MLFKHDFNIYSQETENLLMFEIIFHIFLPFFGQLLRVIAPIPRFPLFRHFFYCVLDQ